MTLEIQPLQLEYEFLQVLLEARAPLGASTLVHTLGKKYALSQATIGRKLMEFDYEGYTVLKGRRGRVLTEKGLPGYIIWKKAAAKECKLAASPAAEQFR